MSRRTTRMLALGIGLAAVIAGVLIVTLNGDAPRRKPASARPQSAAQGAASYLGIDPKTLRSRLRSGETLEQVAESTPGRSSSGLARALLNERTDELRRQGLSPKDVRVRERVLRAKLRAQLRHERRVGRVLAPASKYLGVSEAELRAQIRKGRTLANVAEAHGHSREQLVEAILRVRRTRLDAAHRGRQITQAQERIALKHLRRGIERAVDTQA